MAELKPCPFCGGEDLETSPSVGRIRCRLCGVIMAFGNEPEKFEHITGFIYRKIPGKKAFQIATEHWNRRAGEDGTCQ